MFAWSRKGKGLRQVPCNFHVKLIPVLVTYMLACCSSCISWDALTHCQCRDGTICKCCTFKAASKTFCSEVVGPCHENHLLGKVVLCRLTKKALYPFPMACDSARLPLVFWRCTPRHSYVAECGSPQCWYGCAVCAPVKGPIAEELGVAVCERAP